jgi:hypothetical protein
MTTVTLAAHVLLGTGALMVAGALTHARADSSIRSALDAVAERRVFWGHQSVGMNLIEGLQDLARAEGAALRVAEIRAGVGGPGLAARTLSHAFLEENGAPLKKLAAFSRAFSTGAASGADVALMKFCYVDVVEKTDVTALFAAYQRAVAEVQAASPGTVIVHVTVPLQAVEGGLKAMAKDLLGKPRWGTQHNAAREAYNELLRREYADKAPIFDLARVEATRPDGGAETSRWNGREVRALVSAYTDDGGHLNAEGRRRAAAELARVIAAVPVRAASASR